MYCNAIPKCTKAYTQIWSGWLGASPTFLQRMIASSSALISRGEDARSVAEAARIARSYGSPFLRIGFTSARKMTYNRPDTAFLT